MGDDSVPKPDDGNDFAIPFRLWKDHPVSGVNFPDTAPATVEGLSVRGLIDALARHLPGDVQVLAGIDVGGLGFAGALAYRNELGFLDVRKVGSIRTDVIRGLTANYELGDGVAISKSNRLDGRRVAILDDCLLTGGTALAALQLIRRLGADCATALFVFELDGMGGRARLESEGLTVATLRRLPKA